MEERARVIILVIDGGGAGASEDASRYGDESSANTLANVARSAGGLQLPNLERLGLGCITRMQGVEAALDPLASWARLRESSNGKDSVTGHWEMMGIHIRNAFPTYPHGFPASIIERFESLIGRPVLGNVVASGTEIIERLGPEHTRTGYPIVYTSADSVFQVAAHENVVSVQTLWKWCEKARAVLVPPNRVNRVIARPFSGTPGAYQRTAGRRDYAVAPPSPSMLERLASAGIPTHAIGKIEDIYCGQGIESGSRTADNIEGLAKTVEWLRAGQRGLCFTNLNDFDSKYGHRRDADGFAKALLMLDDRLTDIVNEMRPDDRLLLTADHGCDPTAPGTDHTREFAPLLDYTPGRKGVGHGTVDSFSQVGMRVLASFGVPPPAQELAV
ncbi:MAG: phosphopentomutase [Candidatus Eremiobacter antarcticus]|nr:phosphopentomutase [Candidatus Eremiobacteraeota bacterium]PZR60840.1 MAG: phosphopentomutase [Candidatus Eremiobacter sp. RRmetagenome_bin22]